VPAIAERIAEYSRARDQLELEDELEDDQGPIPQLNKSVVRTRERDSFPQRVDFRATRYLTRYPARRRIYLPLITLTARIPTALKVFRIYINSFYESGYPVNCAHTRTRGALARVARTNQRAH